MQIWEFTEFSKGFYCILVTTFIKEVQACKCYTINPLLMCCFNVSIKDFCVYIIPKWIKMITSQTSSVVFKNNSLYFCHINQDFNVLLYKSFHKFSFWQKNNHHVTQAHAHQHTQPHVHTKTKMRHLWFGTVDTWSSLHWSVGSGGHAVQ